MYTPPHVQARSCCEPCLCAKRADSARFARWTARSRSHRSLPFYLAYADDGTPRALFHVARNNPLAKLADGKRPG